jgi:hypothetical protein
MILAIASLFQNLDDSIDSFCSRGALIFFVIIMNASNSTFEI